MFPINPINYDRTIEMLRAKNYKIAIFLLYDQNQITIHYPMALAEQFWRLNTRATGDYVALLTFFDESLVNYARDPFKNGRGYCNFDRDEIITGMQDESGPTSGVKGICALSDSGRSNPYTTMKKIASALDPDIVNQFPCFIILDPNNPKHYIVQKVKGIKPIVREISDIVNDLEDRDFDLDQYAKGCEQPHYYLSAKELFEINLKASIFGINVQLLKEAIKSDHIEECFNYEEIDRLSKDGYIPAKCFLRNLHKIKCKNINSEIDAVSGLIDQYLSLSFFKDTCSKDEFFFSEIKDYIAVTSIEYLKLAKRFYDGDLKTIRVSTSMAAICLGKMVEDEMNLGVFNIFRGVFNIKLPQYFNRVQNELNSPIRIDFIETQESYDDHNGFTLRFNEWRFPRSNKLKYQKTSCIRKLAFVPSCNISPSDKHYSKKEAVVATRGKIKTIYKSILNKAIDLSKLAENLGIIADTRNLAIHNAEPIRKDDLDKTIKAFEYLVDMHFFEMNKQLQECRSN